MMSEGMIIAILLIITPFIFPVAMKVLGLFTGMVQAYIFGILATVYIAAATRAGEDETTDKKPENDPGVPAGAP
jgi:F-type H+-transporting ATPase subunit a